MLHPDLHLVPPINPILANLHDLGTVGSEVIIRNQGQDLGPGLLAAQDVLVNEAHLFKEIQDNLESSLDAGMKLASKIDLLGLVFHARDDLEKLGSSAPEKDENTLLYESNHSEHSTV